MKKLIASILFFGSFGFVMAQISQNDPYYNHIWNPPVPNPDNSCGTYKVRKTYSHSSYVEHCESPGHQTLYTSIFDFNTNTWGPPIDVPYPHPNSNAAADFWSGYTRNGVYYPGWSKTHTNIKFVDSTKGSCNDFATEATCNGAMVTGKRGSISFAGNNFLANISATLRLLFLSAMGLNQSAPVAPARNTQGVGNVVNLGNDMEMTNGCLWHGKRIDRIVEEEKQCFSDVCMDVDMRMKRAQMEIFKLQQKLSQAADDDKAEIRGRIERLKKVLGEDILSCNANKACISDVVGMDASGSGEDHASCRAKPLCPCPSPAGIPENNPKCRPNPYCMRQQ